MFCENCHSLRTGLLARKALSGHVGCLFSPSSWDGGKRGGRGMGSLPAGRGRDRVGGLRFPSWAPVSSLAPASWRLGPLLSVALPFSHVIATQLSWTWSDQRRGHFEACTCAPDGAGLPSGPCGGSDLCLVLSHLKMEFSGGMSCPRNQEFLRGWCGENHLLAGFRQHSHLFGTVPQPSSVQAGF